VDSSDGSVPAGAVGEDSSPVEVLVALGANLGDPLAQLSLAIRRLREVLSRVEVSDVYLTEPVGLADQPDFHNLVLRGLTSAPVYELHRLGHSIEQEIGREVSARNAPRPIDVDLLAYGPLVLFTPTLQVPHPRMEERSFVLAPLAEIAPEWRHPVSGRTALESLEALAEPSEVRRLGPLR
jgi:2-amino-4-hydroxy-6-hydroxymethyldihydropteridine diphosphokinase